MPKIDRGPLPIRSETPWGTRIEYRPTQSSKTVKVGPPIKFKTYDEAREYARQNGYSGIRITRI